MLRNQVFVLDHMYMSLFSTCGWILRLGVTVALLVSIHPALRAARGVRAADGADVDLAAGGRARRRRSAARRPTAWRATCSPPRRPPPPGKEVRVTGIGERLVTERRAAWERWYGPVSAARWGSAAWHTLAWAVFGAAYVGAVVFVVVGPRRGRRAACCWCSPPASRLSAYIGATVGEIGFLRGFWMDGSRRLAWLEDYAASLVGRRPTCRCPRGLHRGIRFEHVSFAYPGTVACVLDDVISTCPPARSSRIVGENGAGKTTLVKLLAKLYEPTSAAGSSSTSAARAHARRRVARAPGGRVPGFLPLRVPRAPHRRRRRRAAAGRRAGGRGRGRPRRRRRCRGHG